MAEDWVKRQRVAKVKLLRMTKEELVQSSMSAWGLLDHFTESAEIRGREDRPVNGEELADVLRSIRDTLTGEGP